MGCAVTTTDVRQILDELAIVRGELGQLRDQVSRLDADLSGVLSRESEARLRSSIEAEVRARYGLDDEPTDHGGARPSPLASVLPAHRATSGKRPVVEVAGDDERTDPLDGLVDTARRNYRFTVTAVILLVAIIFGGVPQMIAAFQALGYLPDPPVEVVLDAPAPIAHPLPGGMSNAGPEPMP